MEFEYRKPLSDIQLKQRLSKLPVYAQLEFVEGADVLLDKESELYLQVLSESRRRLAEMLGKIKLEIEQDNENSAGDDVTNLPFDLTTEVGQKLTNIAYAFSTNLQSVQIGNAELEERARLAEMKAIHKYKRAFKKRLGAINQLSDSIDSNEDMVNELESNDSEKQIKNYSKSKFLEELGEVAKKEQEEIMEKMKNQTQQFLQEMIRQKDHLAKRLDDVKNKKPVMNEIVVNQLLDKNKELNEIYEKEKDEHDKAFKARLKSHKDYEFIVINESKETNNTNENANNQTASNSNKYNNNNNNNDDDNSNENLQTKHRKKKHPQTILENLSDYEANVDIVISENPFVHKQDEVKLESEIEYNQKSGKKKLSGKKRPLPELDSEKSIDTEQ